MHIALIPPIPGGWGTVESSQVIALLFIGLDPAVGIGVTILARVRDLLTGGLGGIWLYLIFSSK